MPNENIENPLPTEEEIVLGEIFPELAQRPKYTIYDDPANENICDSCA